ncbi:hypothetical protein [Glacieibacterium sp.]|uniref:hypothetical protein n=1 Tax=Glacieibacterium sp. TaxID=2860237 RepID=UPI003B0051D2
MIDNSSVDRMPVRRKALDAFDAKYTIAHSHRDQPVSLSNYYAGRITNGGVIVGEIVGDASVHTQDFCSDIFEYHPQFIIVTGQTSNRSVA